MMKIKTLAAFSLTALSAVSMSAQIVIFADDFSTGTASTIGATFGASVQNIDGVLNDSYHGIATNRFLYNEVDTGGRGGLGILTLYSNGNNAQRGMYYTIDGSAVAAADGTFSFDILSTNTASNIYVALYQVDNATGLAGDVLTYDLAANNSGNTYTDGPLSTAGLIGIFSEGDASSSIIGTQQTIAGDIAAGPHTYDFTYTGGDIVIGISIVGSGSETGHGEFVKLDNFEVTMIPEPATYVLLAGLLALGIVGLRRRR